MRRPLAAILVGVGLVVGLVVWRSPTVALVRLKMALDGQDLMAVSQAIDRHALVQSALGDAADAALAEAARGPGEPTHSQLTLRLDRALERLVEDPEYRLRVSWADLRTTLGTLRRTGAVAFFLYRPEDGGEYVVRLRREWTRWRIVSVERDGAQALLARPHATDLAATPPPADPTPVTPQPAVEDAPPAVASPPSPPAPPAAEEPPASPAAVPATGMVAALVEPDALTPPPVERHPLPPVHAFPPSPAIRAFARKLEGGTWTVQTWSSQDPAEADRHRLTFTDQGQDAFVESVKLNGVRWYRVLVGRYPTQSEATRAAQKLASR
jgi:hypothetical protein